MDAIFDYVPWWVGVLAGLLGVGGGFVALMFFAPALVPVIVGLWNRSPLWVRVALIGLTGGVIAWWIGRNQGRANEQARRDQANARALQTRKEVDDEVRNDSDAGVDLKLKRWLRDD